MIIYEVNIKVDQEKALEYAAWLPGHLKRVLQSEGFNRVTWWQVEESGSSWCIQYEVASRELLEKYFVKDAPRLRQEGLSLFGTHFTAVRRVLVKPQTYP